MDGFHSEIRKHIAGVKWCVDEIERPSCAWMSENDYWVYMAQTAKNLKHHADIIENMFRTVKEGNNGSDEG